MHALKEHGYDPRAYYEGNKELKEAIDLIGSGFFSRGDSNLFKPLIDGLVNHDEYLVLADFQSYLDQQEKVNRVYDDIEQWIAKSILNVSRMGRFSSDRSVKEYVEKIWKVKPLVPVEAN